MQSTIYLLLISFGALFILGIFHLTIYIQQNDKAFSHYAMYLLVMAVFTIVRLLDSRLTGIYPLSYYTVQTLDPILSNIGFLMYVNFLGVILNINSREKIYYKCWKALQVFVPAFLFLYFILRISGDPLKIANTIISTASFGCMGLGLFLTFPLLQLRKEPFYQLIIAGTILSVCGVISGLVINIFVYKDSLSFVGLYFLETSMIVESIFLSAALGYRLKIAYREKIIFQQTMLYETQKREALALQTAGLLRRELSLKEMQNRISKDLHDDIGSSLSSLQIYSSLAEKLMDEQPLKAKELLKQMAENTQEIMSNMEDIVWAMQPAPEKMDSLKVRIRNFSNSLLIVKDIVCDYQFDDEIEKSCNGVDIRKNILLIAKEAINNISKYSEARNVVIGLTKINGNVMLSVNDDGKGFNIHQCKKGNGLNNMETRAKLMNGKTVILSQPGKGTSVISTIPVTNISDTDQ